MKNQRDYRHEQPCQTTDIVAAKKQDTEKTVPQIIMETRETNIDSKTKWRQPKWENK